MFVMTVVVGVSVVVAIGLSPLYVGRLRVARSVRVGAALVVGALGLASLWAAAGRTFGRDELFLALFAGLLVGALLILGEDAEEGDGGGGGEPPWWPEFEADFGRYLRERRRRVSRR